MYTIAYLTNAFPAATEAYVIDEIHELRRRGMRVIPCSAGITQLSADLDLRKIAAETFHLRPTRLLPAISATWLLLSSAALLGDLFKRILLQGRESFLQRIAALAHTWFGAYLTVVLESREVHHIHVHHGYYSCWIAMVAARLLGVQYSLTLHGSDLLMHGVYLDTKLQNCSTCFTVSEFNRNYILARYPRIPPNKVILQRLGVDVPGLAAHWDWAARVHDRPLLMLSVGRLHPVKDHAFLVQACRQLKEHGQEFLCLIAGEGPERANLEGLIADFGLTGCVRLLGHLNRSQLSGYYEVADVVVLTSRSEGIPLALMEAMAYAKPVVAPAITGIPELVTDGRTGFLYVPGRLDEFVANVEMVAKARAVLGPIGRAARRHVLTNFEREKNVAQFAQCLIRRIAEQTECVPDESSLLQQIQLSL